MRISNDPTLNLISPIYLFPLIPRMEMGDVYRIRGLKLSVGTGPENSSILTSKDHDVALEKHSLLLLVPAQWTIAAGVRRTRHRPAGVRRVRRPYSRCSQGCGRCRPSRPSMTSIFARRRSAT